MEINDIEISEVSVERLFNLQAYENVRVGLKAVVRSGQSVDAILAAMDEYLIKIGKEKKIK